MTDHAATNRKLHQAWKAGDAAARDRLIEANLGLVHHAMNRRLRRHRHRRVDEDDLMQAGTIGLMKAIERWNPDRGKLSTYAMQEITASMRREAMYNDYAVKVPDNLAFDKDDAGDVMPIVQRFAVATSSSLTGVPMDTLRAMSTPDETNRVDDQDEAAQLAPIVHTYVQTVPSKRDRHVLEVHLGLAGHEGSETAEETASRTPWKRSQVKSILDRHLPALRAQIAAEIALAD